MRRLQVVIYALIAAWIVILLILSLPVTLLLLLDGLIDKLNMKERQQRKALAFDERNKL